MTCEECETLLLDPVRAAGQEISEHLESCRECRRFRKTLDLALSLPRLDPNLDRRTMMLAKEAMRFKKRRAVFRRVILAAAACLVATLAVVLQFKGNSQNRSVGDDAYVAESQAEDTWNSLKAIGLDVEFTQCQELQALLADASIYLADGVLCTAAPGVADDASEEEDGLEGASEEGNDAWERVCAALTSEMDSLEMMVYGL